MGGDDVDGCEGEGVENEDFAGVLWGDWCCGGVGGLEGWGGGIWMREDEVTVLC